MDSTPAVMAAGAPAGGGIIEMVIMLALIVGIFYFLLIRPQQKRMKQHKEMVENLRRGDRVVTAGGIIGSVVKAGDEEEIVVEIADNVRVQVQKSTIQNVLSKSEPAKGSQAKAQEKGGQGKSESGGKDQAGGEGKKGMAKMLSGGGKK